MDRTVTFKQEETSGHDPQPGLDTKTDRLTDRQSQCDFNFYFEISLTTAKFKHLIIVRNITLN
jgi:hypothetical protein